LLSPQVAERAQFYLGDIQLAQGHYSKARRHLAAAIGSGIGIGETHFLMACALEWDDEADVEAAYRHYRRAVELEPGEPLYSSAYALMRIRRRPGKAKYDRESLQRLRNSFTASPEDPDIVYNYAFGLIEMNRRNEAQLVLRRARKRWPDHPAFEGLWLDYLMRQGRIPQAKSSASATARLRRISNDEPRLLKFPCKSSPEPAVPPLRASARLSTALRSLNGSRLRMVSRQLGVEPSTDAGQTRNAIVRQLRDKDRLGALVAGLSVGSRHLIQVLCNAGGSIVRKELRLRIDSPTGVRGPHWGKRRRSASPLDELRQCGLVYLVPASGGTTTSEKVMIPSDLREVLRHVLRQA
jgi:tetratricopeptide (TPR) repeat protein